MLTRTKLFTAFAVMLAVGLVLLVANNPSVKLPQLPYRRLVRFLFRPLMYSVIAASTFGALAGAGVEQLREWLGVDLGDPVADTRFVIVWGIHVGTYVGVALGLVDAVIGIRRERITMAALTIEASAPPTT